MFYIMPKWNLKIELLGALSENNNNNVVSSLVVSISSFLLVL